MRYSEKSDVEQTARPMSDNFCSLVQGRSAQQTRRTRHQAQVTRTTGERPRQWGHHTALRRRDQYSGERRRRWPSASHGPVLLPLVMVEVGERAEHPAALGAHRATLVQRAVVTQRVSALERLLADRAPQDGHGVTCRAQQQRVRTAALRRRVRMATCSSNGNRCREVTDPSTGEV